MITIVAKSILKKGMKENFKLVAKELVTESRKEEGCISYNLYEDIDNENILTFIEEWKDEDAIKFHRETVHYTKIIPELLNLREDKETNLYKLSD